MAEAVVNSVVDWQIPTFCLVTGASRGLGSKIALEFSKKLCEGSYLLLIARNQEKLDSLAKEIKETSKCMPLTVALDLDILDSPSYEHFFGKWAHKTHFRQVIIVNNAGTLGDVSLTALNCTSCEDVKSYFDLNLHSAMFITTGYLNAFKNSDRKIVINISSLAAVQPIKGWSLYCTGKAARDMFFRVLAQEEPNIVVLNYAPGPLITDMLTQILDKAVPEIKQQFQDAQTNNQLLTCEYSAQRLIGILDQARFQSGDHVDVFDMNY